MKKILLSLMLSCTLFGSVSLGGVTTFAAEEATTIEVDESNVTDITEDQYLENISGIEEVSGQKLLSVVRSNDTYFMFLGFKECPYCREFSKVMKEFKNQSNYPIYYVNVKNVFDDITPDELNEINSFLATKAEFNATPTILKVSNSEILANYVGSETTLDQLLELNTSLEYQ